MISIFAHCGYLSETSRMIEIHRALTAGGAEVRMATHGGVHEPLLAAAGIEYDLVPPVLSRERSMQIARTYGQGRVRDSMHTDAELRAYALSEAAYMRDMDTAVAVTGITVTTLLSTRLAGVALATEHAGSFVPPVFERGLLPAPSTPVLMKLPGPIAAPVTNRALPWLRWYAGGLRRVAKDLHVPPVPGLAAMLLGDLTLVPEIPEVLGIAASELEAWRPGRHYWPTTRLCYSGPLFAHLALPVPDDVERFLSGAGPIVYVALCSTSPETVRGVARSLSGLGARLLVTATVHDVADLNSAEVLVTPTLPSHLIMPRVDLAVITGGQGSVQTAMACGTPFIGVPLQLEQDLNVALIERQGAARLLSQRDAPTPRVASVAREMLSTDSYQRNARKIQDLYSAVDGPADAAETLMQLADGRSRSARPSAAAGRQGTGRCR